MQSITIAQQIKSLVRTHVYYFVYRYNPFIFILSPKFVSMRKEELNTAPYGAYFKNRRCFTGKNPGSVYVKSLRSRARQKIRKTTIPQLLHVVYFRLGT
jgi:hypothetical protein